MRCTYKDTKISSYIKLLMNRGNYWSFLPVNRLEENKKKTEVAKYNNCLSITSELLIFSIHLVTEIWYSAYLTDEYRK